MEYNPDMDKGLVPIFRNHTEYNHAASQREGRPMYDDVEIVEVHIAGRKDYPAFPALAQSHWARDPATGMQYVVTYAERWSKQYQQFKAKEQQTKTGTPLDHLPFLTPARCAELRALKVYTAEALAGLDGQDLKNLGTNGRELKNQAVAYIEHARQNTVPEQVRAELEALRSQNEMLANDVKILREALPPKPAPSPDKLDSNFEGMDDERLTAFITAKTGVEPRGNPARKTLIQMAETASKAAL